MPNNRQKEENSKGAMSRQRSSSSNEDEGQPRKKVKLDRESERQASTYDSITPHSSFISSIAPNGLDRNSSYPPYGVHHSGYYAPSPYVPPYTSYAVNQPHLAQPTNSYFPPPTQASSLPPQPYYSSQPLQQPQYLNYLAAREVNPVRKGT